MSKANAGPAPQSSQETTDQILKAYTANIPGLLQATTSGTTDQAKNELAAAQAVTPGYNQLALDSLKNYGQQVADANNTISSNTLVGSGADVARKAQMLEDELNPQYKAAREQSTNLLNSINLNGLSGGERAEVERALGKSNVATGNLGLDNATNAVSAAMNFGDRLSQKRAELANAINTANGTTSLSGPAPNPTNLALGNAATNFNAVNPQSSAGALGFGTGALNSITGATGNQNNIMADYNYKNSAINKLNNIGANS